MDAGSGGTFDHHEYLVGFNFFERLKAQLASAGARSHSGLTDCHDVALISDKGLHKLVRRLPDLFCRHPWSVSIGCIVDRKHSNLPSVFHWHIYRPSHRCGLLSFGLL